MASTPSVSPVRTVPVGRLIQHWRRARGKSQLALSLEAGISTRHLGFVEVGRANPSREMVLRLAGVLGVPLRERNALLHAAGYAPQYGTTGWQAPEMEHARRAVGLILQHQEPYPAVVMDRHWNMLDANAAAARFFARLIGRTSDATAPNVIRLMFDPTGVRPYVANWEAVAFELIQRVHREALGGVPDTATSALLDEVLAYPGVPRRWATPDATAAPRPYLAIEFRKDDLALDFFSTVTTLGTPFDVTLQEMRIECFFPANERTRAAAKDLEAP
jgi:transcriptional regulator with XRE-family HTH domain